MANITLDDSSWMVKIKINGITYVSFKKTLYVGFQSWMETDHQYPWIIEIYLQGTSIVLEFNSAEKWTTTIGLLDTIT